MGFLPKGVWIMDYCGFMGYGIHFFANQLGGLKKVWGIREYGLLELWVKRELTVLSDFSKIRGVPGSECQTRPWLVGFCLMLKKKKDIIIFFTL